MKILFVHVTDIHWGDRGFPTDDRATTIGSALANIMHGTPEAIVMVYSGDFVWSGQSKDYESVREYLEKIELSLRECYQGIPLKRIACPGNHDCDFNLQPAVRNALMEKVVKERTFKGPLFDVVISPQVEFFKFEESFSKTITEASALWKSADKRLGWIYPLTFGDMHLNVIGLNTAWLSEVHEVPGKVEFPTGKFPTLPAATTNLAVFHHPLSWLSAGSAHNLRANLLQNMDMVFCGHEHQELALGLQDEIRKSKCRINEGAAFFDHQGTDENDGFTTILYDSETAMGESFSFKWRSGAYVPFRGDSVIDASTYTPELIEVRNHGITNRKPQLSETFSKWLSDPELPLRSRDNQPISLDDIFVMQDLKKVKLKGITSSTPALIRDLGELVQHQYLMVVGPKNSGKTAIAKQYCRAASQTDIYPLYLDGRKIKAHQGNIHQYVELNISQQYSDEGKAFNNHPNSEKALVIDDFHSFVHRNPKVVEVLDTLRARFGRLFLFAHDIELGPLEVVNFVKDSKWGEAAIYSTQPFSFPNRNQLVDRWIRTANSAISTSDLAQKRYEVNKTLDVIVGRNYVPQFPPYILAVLQGIESGGDIDLSTSTHGHLYEIFIKTCLARKTTSTNYNVFSNFLGMLAYKAFMDEVEVLSEDYFDSVHTQFQQEYAVVRPLGKLKEDLIDVGLLRRIDDCFYFSEKFVLYYFVAYYIKDRIDDEAIRQSVEEMAERLWVEDYAHVMLFLVHLSKADFIVSKMLEKSAKLFSEFLPAKLEDDDVSFMAAYGTDNYRPVALEQPTTEDQVAELASVSEESLMPEFELAPPRHVDPADVDELARMNAAIEAMQLVGQILKNFPASFKAPRKIEMAENCINLGLRCLSFYFHFVKSQEVQLLKEIGEMLAPGLKRSTDQERDQRAGAFLLTLCRITTFGLVKRISNSIGSRDLEPTYAQIFSDGMTNSRKLVQASLKLDHLGGFPETLVLKRAEEWEHKPFQTQQLRMLVARHFRVFETPQPIKQRIAKKLEIDLRKADFLTNSGRIISPRRGNH